MRHRLPDRTRIRVLVRVRPYQPVFEGQLHPEAVRGGSACQNVRKAHAMQGGRSFPQRHAKPLSYSAPVCFILFDEACRRPFPQSCRNAQAGGGYHFTGRE